MASKRAVLITGCSEGGTGSALAVEFHKAGLHVYATARDVLKMKHLEALGIDLLPLDIVSEESIAACVRRVSKLDILINNAGASYTMPISDISLSRAKQLFDTNVWGHIAVTQAFLPLLLQSSQAVIANHTSVGSDMGIPFQAVYNASKAAFSMFSDIMRLELQPFDVKVVNLKTAGVETNVIQNVQASCPSLPENSIYAPARELVDKALRLEWSENMGISAEQWAKEVVRELLKNSPPSAIWKGKSAGMARTVGLLPSILTEGTVKKMTGLDKIEAALRSESSKIRQR